MTSEEQEQQLKAIITGAAILAAGVGIGVLTFAIYKWLLDTGAISPNSMGMLGAGESWEARVLPAVEEEDPVMSNEMREHMNLAGLGIPVRQQKALGVPAALEPSPEYTSQRGGVVNPGSPVQLIGPSARRPGRKRKVTINATNAAVVGRDKGAVSQGRGLLLSGFGAPADIDVAPGGSLWISVAPGYSTPVRYGAVVTE
jgi:hypothetical protein